MLIFCDSAGNSLDYTEKDLEIMHEHGAAVKEMEAGSIGWVAALYKVPLLCIKVSLAYQWCLLRSEMAADLINSCRCLYVHASWCMNITPSTCHAGHH